MDEAAKFAAPIRGSDFGFGFGRGLDAEWPEAELDAESVSGNLECQYLRSAANLELVQVGGGRACDKIDELLDRLYRLAVVAHDAIAGASPIHSAVEPGATAITVTSVISRRPSASM